MAKWVYAFEDDEIDIVLSALKHSAECPSLLENKDLMKNLFDKMRARIKQEQYIKHHVFIVLSTMGSKRYEELNEDQNLKYDLHLTIYHKRALKSSFENILKEFGSSKTITYDDCEKFEKVSDCIALLRGKL
jgi:enoyl-[acyl-carrier-protein] reductase (NADH)